MRSPWYWHSSRCPSCMPQHRWIQGVISVAAAISLPCRATTCVFTGNPAGSKPSGGQVVAGKGSIIQAGNTTDIVQLSQDLFLNWLSFNVGPQETVNFLQPSSSAIAVNRILDSNGSQILGHINANGDVWLINPNGVLFGQDAQVNVGGLVASTLNVGEVGANGAVTHFGGNGAGSVVNQGTINAADGGYVALLGNHVSNQGTITANLGTVALGAGSAATLTFSGNSLVKMQVDASTLNNLAENGKLIKANGGAVIMSAGAKNALLASVVNNTGVIEARSVDNHDGTISLLGGADTGTVNVGGTLDASAPSGGRGGAIETSAAHVEVASDAKITTKAAAGSSGTWLIDPTDFTIAASGGDMTGGALATALNAGNVTILSSQGHAGTSGNINVNAAVTAAPAAATTLTLDAIGSIFVNSAIKSTGAALNLSLNTAATGSVTLANSLTLAGGNVDVGSYTGGTVTPSVGTLNVTAGTTTLTGVLTAGTLGISGGALTLSTAESISTVNLSGGTLKDTLGLSANSLTANGGTVLGSLTLNSGGTGTVNGNLATLNLGSGATAGTFTNKGTITDSTAAGSYSMIFAANSVFNNQGSYTLTGQSIGFSDPLASEIVNNSGSFTTNGGAGSEFAVGTLTTAERSLSAAACWMWALSVLMVRTAVHSTFLRGAPLNSSAARRPSPRRVRSLARGRSF